MRWGGVHHQNKVAKPVKIQCIVQNVHPPSHFPKQPNRPDLTMPDCSGPLALCLTPLT